MVNASVLSHVRDYITQIASICRDYRFKSVNTVNSLVSRPS